MKKEKEITPSLKATLAALEKQYGDGVILSGDSMQEVESISTGCFAIDNLLGCGGLPKGRIMEIFGQESSGKSTLCLFFAAQVQKQGGKVVYIDAENAYDREYASGIGVDTDKLLVAQPETLEESFDIMRALAETNEIDLIIVDSVAALVPKSELEGEQMLKETVGVQARLLGKALRIITGPVSRSKTIVIFINQVRTNVGVMWGNPETTPGGKALKFFSSVRIKVSKGDKIKGKGEEQIGNVLKLSAVKNKVGFPFKNAEISLYYGAGIDLIADTLTAALENAIVVKTGNTYSFGEVKLGVGEVQTVNALKTNQELLENIRAAITNKNHE